MPIVEMLIKVYGPGMSMSMSKAQSWSFDVTLGVIIFLTAFISIFTLINHQQESNAGSIQAESSYLLNQMKAENSPLRIVQDNNVNESGLGELASLPYNNLKTQAGAKNDFCIYIEDADGNIILINDSMGIGSPDINVSGTPCG